MGGTAAKRPPRSFRPDIEGLRAVAVVAVVAYHAGLGLTGGGYVGVDVFYVISGFLITELLWREVAAGGVSFAGFYARRARRILPAAAVVIVATIAASATLLPPLQVGRVWKDGLYCALFAGNFRFAATGTNYLADHTPSPFQHFWSLGVEEQFYLVWPALLVLAAGAWLRAGHRPSRLSAAIGLGAVSAASLALSAAWTATDQPLAFFLLPARAWELGLGGLVALSLPLLRRLAVPTATGLAWAGLAAIVAAVVGYDSHTPFPGTAALLPVLGSASVIAGGVTAADRGAGRLLGRSGPRAVGRISYSWYLWHYPVVVLAPYAFGHALSVADNVGLSLLSALAAVITFRFVETPGRRSRWLAERPARAMAAGLSLSTAATVACLGAWATIPALNGHGRAPVATIHTPTAVAPPAGTAAPDPALVALHSAEAQVSAAVATSASIRDVPANLQPPLASASASEAAPMVDGCLTSYLDVGVPTCLFGDTTASRSVVLFGDSHATMWFPAVDSWANANHYRLYVWTKAACPPVSISIYSPVLGRTWTECSRWYTAAMARIATVRPALVVLGIAPNYDAAYRVTENGPAWLSGLDATISGVRAAGGRVLVIGSAPSPPMTVPDCLSAHLTDAGACTFSPVGRHVSGGGLVGVDRAGADAEASSVRAAGGLYADVVPWFCTPAVCDVIVDNLLVYRDNSHITVPYADYLAPLVGAEMTVALGPAT